MRIIPNQKLPAGALQFTIFLAVLIALILAGLLILNQTHRHFLQQSGVVINNVQLTDSGIDYLLTNDVAEEDTVAVPLPSSEGQQIKAFHRPWGIYSIGIVKAQNKNKVFFKTALIGTKLSPQQRPALYLSENFNPLVLVGETVIKGNAFLPKQGVKPGYIFGESFHGRQLVSGAIRNSDTILPKPDKRFLAGLKRMQMVPKPLKSETLPPALANHCVASFLEQTKWYGHEGIIVLDGNSLTGNIIVSSKTKIVVRNTANLADVILIAPLIEIEDGTNGNFQAIASKAIHVGKNCRLNYPSALVMIEDENELPQPPVDGEKLISVDTGSEIKGTLCYLKPSKRQDFRTQVEIKETAILTGEIYCEGNLDLKGTVSGTVYTDQFITAANGSMLTNTIYNGKIISEDLHESFSGFRLENTKKGVAKWMY